MSTGACTGAAQYNSKAGLLCLRSLTEIASSLDRAVCGVRPFKLASVFRPGLSVAWPQACMHRHARSTDMLSDVAGCLRSRKKVGSLT